MAEIHKYLTSMEKYKVDFPFYVDNLFTKEEEKQLTDVIYKNKYELDEVVTGANDAATEHYDNRFRPKKVEPMSRMLVEFEMPKNLENILDNIENILEKAKTLINKRQNNPK
mgnify:CR=1 FL=1